MSFLISEKQLKTLPLFLSETGKGRIGKIAKKASVSQKTIYRWLKCPFYQVELIRHFVKTFENLSDRAEKIKFFKVVKDYDFFQRRIKT